MLVVAIIRNRNIHFVPPRIARLVPTEQQDRRAARIECIKHTKRPPLHLDAKFSHVLMARTFDTRSMGVPKMRALFFEQTDGRIYLGLFIFTERIPPRFEWIDEFNLPSHR